MAKVDIQTDAQFDLLQALVALRDRFLAAGVTVSRAEVENWLAGIDAVDTLAKWRAYEKKRALLEIECWIAALRRM